jgi:hypothetical protein
MLYTHQITLGPIIVVARSKAQNVFIRSTTAIVGSNPTTGIDVCLRRYCICVTLCREGSYDGLLPHERISYQLLIRFIVPD